MSSALEKLSKFVLLEKKRNFDDRAVFGGLEEILPNWMEEARNENIDIDLINEVSTRIKNYKSQNIETRARTVDEILELIQFMPTMAHSDQTIRTQPAPLRMKTTSNDNGNGNEQFDYKMCFAPVTSINGVGESIAEKLGKLGIFTIQDLLEYYPRRYDDFSNLQPINRLEYGKEITAIGTVKSIASRPTKNPHITLTEAVLTDGTGYLRLSWFNQPYLENVIKPEMQIVVSGKVDRYLGRLSLSNPEWEKLEQEQLHTNRIVPVYHLTSDLKQRSLRNIIYKAVTYWANHINDYLPVSIREDAGLMDMRNALLQIHFPDSMENLRKAQLRIAFDEIFLLQIGALQQKRKWQSHTAQSFAVADEWLQEQQAKLSFPLTLAQSRSLEEIRNDLCSGMPMNRLLQGDVGSGKTIVAALASSIVIQNGAQVAILSPTSILAEQHYRNFQNLFSSTNSNGLQLLPPEAVRLLIGNTSPADREAILTGLISGDVKILIGTHAILEDMVRFSNLQLAIIDEQHRFGVKQRAQLRAKGMNPHLLVMTATPIPRSLALTIYGDLDLSVIDELPAGRQEIETHLLQPLERERAYSLIRSQIKAGCQAFIIYPLVEENDTNLEETEENSKAAVNEYERLKNEIFPHARLGLIHGRMKQEEKDKVMAAFRDQELDILVSTSVIEVGVDIPNATVMLIEGANRFGLAQLHQLRGRVGRGNNKSYCLLIPETMDAVESERLIAMASTQDGFTLSEKDLAQRGPGEFLGIRQSGYSNLKMASLSNIRLIEKARFYASELFKSDPDLIKPEHRSIKPLVQSHWNDGQGDIS